MHTGDMSSHLPPLPDSAITRLFTRRHFELVGDDALWMSLPGGQTLFQAGEAADMVYILRTGRLGVFRLNPDDNTQQLMGIIRPGEPIGEMAMISGMKHGSTIQALRDSELLALPRRAFMRLTRAFPQLMSDIARLMVYRLRTAGRHNKSAEPNVFTLIGLTASVDIRDIADTLKTSIERMGHSVGLITKNDCHQSTEWFSKVESQHDYTLFCANHSDHTWISQCLRQADRAMLFGLASDPAPKFSDMRFNTPLVQQGFIDLVLIHPELTRAPKGAEQWFSAILPQRLMHIINGHQSDMGRLARVVTGRSVGIVLSGGGARAYAHLGAIRALRESRVPLDFVGGTSMGAVIAASVAMGWSDEEIEDRLRVAFVEANPLSDLTIPVVAMTRGRKVEKLLEQHFGDVEIADLWRPFFCLSSNLTTGMPQIHKNERLRDALRASLAIPGLIPPVVRGDNVLVDGAVMKNFPADIMRNFHNGLVIGVDVTRAHGLTADDLSGPHDFLPWLMSGQTHKGPPIVSILMRSATVRAHEEVANRAENVDMLILPPLEDVEIRDWKAFDRATRAGYEFTVKALRQLDQPLTSMSKRVGNNYSAGIDL